MTIGGPNCSCCNRKQNEGVTHEVQQMVRLIREMFERDRAPKPRIKAKIIGQMQTPSP